MTKMNAGDFKPGDLVRWIGEGAFPLVDAPPRENTVLAIEADGKVRLEGRHGGEAPVQWWCPPDQLVHHRKALRARTPEETAADQARKARDDGAREYREFLQWLGIGEPKAATSTSTSPAAPISVGRWEDDEALDELMNQLAGARGEVRDLNAERDATAKRLRDIMSACFDGSRSGDLAFQLADMEEWIPKFTSEWKANHRRWLALCDRLGFDALDLSQHGRVAEVDAVAGDALELRRIRAIVEDDARKRHGDREGEPSWGVIADCVLGHASQHRQAREILGVAENVTLDQGLSELRQVLWAFEASLVSSGEWSTCPSRAMGALIRAVVAQAEQWRARLRDGVDDDRAFVHNVLSTAEVLVRELKEAREQLAGAMNLIASLRADMTRVEPSAARAEIQAVACQATTAERPKVRCTGHVTVRINKDRVIVTAQTWTSDDPTFKAWDVSLHDDDPRFGFGAPQQRSHVGPTMELGERTGTWTWRGSMGGFGDIKWQGAWTAEPKQAASAEIERLDYSRFPPGYSGETTSVDAWSEWKAKNDPPGFTLYRNGPTWSWAIDVADGVVVGEPYAVVEDARRHAWKWYDRRRALARVVRHQPDDSILNMVRLVWPRCLTWSDEQVAEVERWLVDSTAEMPEVLRG